MYDRIQTAAERIVAHSEALGAAVHNFREGVAAKRREAVLKGGNAAGADLSAMAGEERIAQEILGVLLANGLGDLFENAHISVTVPAVSDFETRWSQRIARGQLETTRNRGTERNPVIGSAGVR